MGNEYSHTAAGPTRELALLALQNTLLYDDYDARIHYFKTPGELAPRIDIFFEPILEFDGNAKTWELKLGEVKLFGKYSSRQGVIRVWCQLNGRNTILGENVQVGTILGDTITVMGYGPSIDFALVALISNLYLTTGLPAYCILLSKMNVVTNPLRTDYTLQMESATRLGTGEYTAHFKEMDGLFIASIRRKEGYHLLD